MIIKRVSPHERGFEGPLARACSKLYGWTSEKVGGKKEEGERERERMVQRDSARCRI